MKARSSSRSANRDGHGRDDDGSTVRGREDAVDVEDSIHRGKVELKRSGHHHRQMGQRCITQKARTAPRGDEQTRADETRARVGERAGGQDIRTDAAVRRGVAARGSSQRYRTHPPM